ncbi:uncharacterized protein F4822DRAFT_420903 [Hypoxylon trugodes]|uniref:uncharacterized protein n=1 Tax=Hypoxylon trugodes TaxID=326681 RepID=UPI0021960B71|nr:uncharacterized protein F4822DRAFT_420903 [Hypoxylon trugodes]KAI1383525.1 hypothetical protein F4822DRAFT_420903 [Hypoxylon trugodes]
MGSWDWDGESVISTSTRRSRSGHHKTSKSRDSSRSHRSSKRHSGLASFFGVGGNHSHRSTSGSHYAKNNASKSSLFNLAGGNNSTRSFFSFGRSNSYYKRQPRSSFLQRTLKKLKRLLRDLVYYAKRHPLKVFMLVIMPLITGGALTALLARFGLRLPPTIERMLGVAARAGSGDSTGLMSEAVRMAGGLGRHESISIERAPHGHHNDYQWERRREYHGESSGSGGFFSGIRDFFS